MKFRLKQDLPMCKAGTISKYNEADKIYRFYYGIDEENCYLYTIEEIKSLPGWFERVYKFGDGYYVAEFFKSFVRSCNKWDGNND